MEAGPTRVPEVVDALIAAAQEEFGKAAVVDGPRSTEGLPNDVILIGFAGPGSPAVHTDLERAQGLGHRYTETFTIQCLISSYLGGGTMKQRRDTCADWLARIETRLKASRGLGGAADLVGLGPSQEWNQAQTADGPVCEVNFDVVGEAAL